MRHYVAFFALAGCAIIAACSSGSVPNAVVPRGLDARSAQGNGKPTPCPAANYTCIQHIVIIIQENRSFNNLFMGFPGAATRRFGMAGSVAVPIQPRTFESSIGDISHCFEDAMNAWHGGKMDG